MPLAILHEERHTLLGEERIWRKKLYFQHIEFIITLFVLLFGACSIWRGFWVALDQYLFRDNMQLSIWAGGLIGMFCILFAILLKIPMRLLSSYSKSLQFKKLSAFFSDFQNLKKKLKFSNKSSRSSSNLKKSYKIPLQKSKSPLTSKSKEGYSEANPANVVPELLIRKNSFSKLTVSDTIPNQINVSEPNTAQDDQNLADDEEPLIQAPNSHPLVSFLRYNAFVLSVKSISFVMGRLFIIYLCWTGICFWRSIWLAWDFYTAKNPLFLAVSCIVGIFVLLPFNNLSAANSCPNPTTEDEQEINDYLSMYTIQPQSEDDALKIQTDLELTGTKKQSEDEQEEEEEARKEDEENVIQSDAFLPIIVDETEILGRQEPLPMEDELKKGIT